MLASSPQFSPLIPLNSPSIMVGDGSCIPVTFVEIDLHFIRDWVAIGDVRVLHVPTTSQFADIFTKGLPSSTFSEFRSSLNVAGG
jgi:hypothetical protein